MVFAAGCGSELPLCFERLSKYNFRGDHFCLSVAPVCLGHTDKCKDSRSVTEKVFSGAAPCEGKCLGILRIGARSLLFVFLAILASRPQWDAQYVSQRPSVAIFLDLACDDGIRSLIFHF
jgi:hypothetical protein